MSKLEVDTIAPQSGTTITVGEAGDTVDVSNATLSANLNANNLTSGTIPDARFPATLPAVNGSNLTNIQIAGGYTACDAITVTNTATFALTAGGSAVSPESASNCIVSLNGIVQAPGDSYTISGSNITFASALVAGSDVIDFITVLGTALNVGTVSDGTIGLNKLSASGTKDATTFLRGDNTFAEAGGGLVQVVQSTYTTETAIASTSFTDTGLTASITPSSSSNKILIMVALQYTAYRDSNSPVVSHAKILRGSTDVFENSEFIGSQVGTGSNGYQQIYGTVPLIYLDSPSTTSATAYKVQVQNNTTSGNRQIKINHGSNSTSTMTLLEVSV